VDRRMLAWWQSLSGSERGASLVEYAFLALLIAMAALLALRFLGEEVNADIEQFNTELDNARSAAPSS